ncbi:hypothetical protein BD309DRAFT_372292 [Dichomitus squalens]|nr:hypothetical protein BD309DRAFT_372292 [Dichomitus squalens]
MMVEDVDSGYKYDSLRRRRHATRRGRYDCWPMSYAGASAAALLLYPSLRFILSAGYGARTLRGTDVVSLEDILWELRRPPRSLEFVLSACRSAYVRPLHFSDNHPRQRSPRILRNC